MSLGELIRTVLGVALLVGVACGAIVLLNQMWTALSGRRHDGMDDEYESRPCIGCGYDLRGITTACPECGRPVRVGDVAGPLCEDFDVRRLRDDWPKADIEPVVPQPWEPLTEIYSTREGWLTDLLIDQLAARGVWARVNAKTKEEVVGPLAHTVTVHNIAVADADVSDAEAVLDLFRIEKDAVLHPPQSEVGGVANASVPLELEYRRGRSESSPRDGQS